MTLAAEEHLELMEGVSRIAVLRANGLGDLVFSLPALDALRRTYPQARITLLGKALHRELFDGRDGPVDHVVVIPDGVLANDVGPEVDTAQAEIFFRQMRREGFDIALQLHGGGRHSNPFVLSLGAKLTVGLKAPEAAPLDRWVPYIYFQREVLRYLEVVALVGAATPSISPCLRVTEADIAEANTLVVKGARPLVVLHPGATDKRRRWPAERFAAVGDTLAAAGAHVVVTGTPPEAEPVRGVVEAMHYSAEDLCGKLSLRGLIGLLAQAAVVVSNDSGPLHLADAVGAATVGIYWCGNLLNGGPITQARHRAAVSWRLDCPVCGSSCLEETCPHEETFVDDVSVEEVRAEALDLLRMTGAH